MMVSGPAAISQTCWKDNDFCLCSIEEGGNEALPGEASDVPETCHARCGLCVCSKKKSHLALGFPELPWSLRSVLRRGDGIIFL